MRPKYIYKIFQLSEWQAFQKTGTYKGSPVDLADGFIHLSCAHQMQGTLDKHYTDAANLIVGKIDAAVLGPALKYETSRGGEDFPHLYADMRLDAVSQYWPLSPDDEGRYVVTSILQGEPK